MSRAGAGRGAVSNGAAVHLFVYGSLLRGQPQDGLVAAFVALPATCRGRLYLMPAGYPVLVHDPDGPEIAGELLVLDQPGVLGVLDLYEGVDGGLYRRATLPVTARGRVLSAFAYVMSAEQVRRRRLRALEATDWRHSGHCRRR